MRVPVLQGTMVPEPAVADWVEPTVVLVRQTLVIIMEVPAADLPENGILLIVTVVMEDGPL